MKRMIKVLSILLAISIVGYAGLVGMVYWKETHTRPADKYDAIIVLGAQVLPTGEPSVQLTWRLDKGFEQWEKHPCPVVVCGAQGSAEPAPEGQIMREYLIEKGIPENQVLADCTSRNTRQNLNNAAELLKDYPIETVLIVTSDYHLPRAIALSGDIGLNATGVGSPCRNELPFWLKNHGREALSWVKYWLQKYFGLNLE